MTRSAAIVVGVVAASLILVGCGIGDGNRSAVQGAGQGGTPAKTEQSSPRGNDSATPTVLNTENWELVAQDPERYKGSPVVVDGEVFNVLDESDGYFRFQIYTDPTAAKGNTHVAVKSDPKVKKGYQVRATGTVKGIRVSRSVSGKELKIPEIEAETVEITGPPSVVTPTATSTPSPSLTPTTVPTVTPSPRPATATATPKASSSPTAAPATATSQPSPSPSAAPATDTPSASPSPAVTLPPEAASSPEATPEPTPPAAAVPEGPVSVEAYAGQAQLSGPMAMGADDGAANGQYVYSTVSDTGWNGRGNPPPTGEAVLSVEVPRDGSYAVWARMWYGNVNANSYWLIVDSQPPIRLGNDDGGYRQWKWVGWHDDSPKNRVAVELATGQHTLRLVGRESGTRLDRVLLTDDPNYVPQ
ncbi:MAG: hypothetical protein ACYC3V_04995 [Chloroflexota bacterium]